MSPRLRVAIAHGLGRVLWLVGGRYLSVILMYRRRHAIVEYFVPIDSRTVTGYTAFHAAFLKVSEGQTMTDQHVQVMPNPRHAILACPWHTAGKTGA